MFDMGSRSRKFFLQDNSAKIAIKKTPVIFMYTFYYLNATLNPTVNTRAMG